jgi:hypothetical protein
MITLTLKEHRPFARSRSDFAGRFRAAINDAIRRCRFCSATAMPARRFLRRRGEASGEAQIRGEVGKSSGSAAA